MDIFIYFIHQNILRRKRWRLRDMLFRKEKRVLVMSIMLVLTTFVAVQTNVLAAGRPPVAEAGGPYIVDECEIVPFDASGSFDPDGDPLQYRWNFSGSWTNWSSSPYIGYLWLDDFQGIIFLEVSDGDLIGQDSAEVTITNVPPSNLVIVGPVDPVYIGDEVVISVNFMDGDPRVGGSLDLHYATFFWGDGSSTEYDLASGVFSVNGSYTYMETGEYEIFIILEDEHGGMASGYWYVTVGSSEMSPVEAGPDATINEGDTFVSAGFIADIESPAYTATVDYGDGTASEPLMLLPGNVFDLCHHYCENGMYTVLVTVFEDGIEWNSDTAIVTVDNVPPTIVSLSGPPTDPIRIGVSLQLVGVFTDPGCLDSHRALIQWGDNQTTVIDLPAGVYQINVNHIYTTAGVYTITLTVIDDDNGSDSKSIETFVVVYDPNSGFVTGGGWIISQPGSYPADPSLTGKANFGFVSKYKKGQSIPEGNTEFQFQMANLNFHSHTYEWLVIAGPKAMYKGVGTINGAGHYGFMLTAIDGQINGGGGVDKFRIKIWDKDNNDLIVYDNNLGAPDDNNPTTVLGGGQITIHKT